MPQLKTLLNFYENQLKKLFNLQVIPQQSIFSLSAYRSMLEFMPQETWLNFRSYLSEHKGRGLKTVQFLQEEFYDLEKRGNILKNFGFIGNSPMALGEAFETDLSDRFQLTERLYEQEFKSYYSKLLKIPIN